MSMVIPAGLITMGKPRTILEDIAAHVLSFGCTALDVESKAGSERVFMRQGDSSIKIATFESSSRNAKELRENLYAANKKPVRMAYGGQVWTLRVDIHGTSGEGASAVSIDPAPRPDASVAPRFTKKQGQYLAYIYFYSKLHRQAPSFSDMEQYFQTSPPVVNDMVKRLELAGLIERTPREARSIRLLVAPEHLPPLE